MQWTTGTASEIKQSTGSYVFSLTPKDGSGRIDFYRTGTSHLTPGENVRVKWDTAVVPPLGGRHEALGVKPAEWPHP
jgi:hypothetical protein